MFRVISIEPFHFQPHQLVSTRPEHISIDIKGML